MSEIDNGIVDEVPTGWSMAKGSDLFDFVRGVSYSKNDATFAKTKGHIAILRAGNLQAGSIIFDDLVHVPSTYVSDPQKLRKGDLVIAMSSGSASVVGKVAIVSEDMKDVSFGAFCGLIRPRNETVSSWLKQYFQSGAYRTLISSTAAGININNLKREHLADLDIPVPPEPEISRATAKIEALQSRSRMAREALEAIPPMLEQFRQSVLAAAFRGDLTADWRDHHPDVEPASVLLECIRAERRRIWETAEVAKFKAKGKLPKDDSWKDRYVEPEAVDDADLPELPEGWCWASVGEITNNFDSARIPLKISDRDKRSGPYPYYGAFGIIDDIDEYLFEGEYILLAEDGKNLMDRRRPVSLVASGRFWVNNHAHVLTAAGGMPLRYLMHHFNSPSLDLNRYLTGIDQVKLTRAAMDSIPVPIAPLREQAAIVRLCNSAVDTINSLSNRVESLSEFAGQLDQSILAKAFRGELVPQDPNDEPASVLLERIRAERAGETNGKPKRQARVKES